VRTAPYQGLVPYAAEDSEWFFGRDEWRDLVVDNLQAYRTTVLYAASGVGKSSLLQAAVVPRLLEDARRRQAAYGIAETAVAAFGSWSGGEPLEALKGAIDASVESVRPGLAPHAPEAPLADVVARAAEQVGGPLLVVLDQFEEYFLYHPTRDNSFDRELSLVLRRRDVSANVLISIREDALAKLDRFVGRVPHLLDNLVRLEPLSTDAARAAIEAPIGQWNRLVAGATDRINLEPNLADEVLAQLESLRLAAGDFGAAGVDEAPRSTAGDPLIEAPYLQLVLMRLWEEEQRSGSRVLRRSTLERLGGAERIVRRHLDVAMSALPPREQKTAERAFRYLVTPSGTKIAYRLEDLAEYADVPAADLAPVLDKLSGDARILRPLGRSRYEIFHDALAGPILDWRERWHQRRRWRRTVIVGACIAAVTAAGIVAAVVIVTPFGSVSRAVPKLTTVPTLLGLTPFQAQLRLQDADLQLGSTLEKPRSSRPGTIVDQIPVAGARVATRTSVSVYAGVGVAATTVPNVVGLTLRRASDLLSRSDLEMQVVGAEPTSLRSRLSVADQLPAARSRSRVGSVVTVTASRR
jgi:hypothetical protein